MENFKTPLTQLQTEFESMDYAYKERQADLKEIINSEKLHTDPENTKTVISYDMNIIKTRVLRGSQVNLTSDNMIKKYEMVIKEVEG